MTDHVQISTELAPGGGVRPGCVAFKVSALTSRGDRQTVNEELVWHTGWRLGRQEESGLGWKWKLWATVQGSVCICVCVCLCLWKKVKG